MSNQATLKNLFAGRVKITTVIDYIEKRLIEQGKPSFSQNVCGGTCEYFGADGVSCAVGVILPKKMKGKILRDDNNSLGFYELVDTYADELNYVYTDLNGTVLNVLGDIQRIHDDYSMDGIETPWNEYIKEQFALYRKNNVSGLKELDRDLTNKI